MSRLMSFALTEASFLDGTKTMTRRLGWWTDKNGRRLLLPGDRITGCRKVMGRKKGDPLVRLGEAHVTAVYRQRLIDMPDGDVIREGVPVENFDEVDGNTGHPPAWEWTRWFAKAQGCLAVDEVTVIEFYRVPPAEMLPGADGDGEGLCEKWCMAQCQGLCGANR